MVWNILFKMCEENFKEEEIIDCRTELGITIGLIDSIITIGRILRKRNLTNYQIKEALKDLQSDEDINYLLNLKEKD